MDIAWAAVALLGCILVVGAVTQSVAGFGIAVVTAPFVVILAPELMPGAMLLATLPLPLLEVARRWRQIDMRVLSWGLVGRLATTPLGVLLVGRLSPTSIGLVVGIMVLVAVSGSLWAFEVRPGRVPALVAGLITGVSGTAASISGPFLGLVLQHARPAQLRSTMAAFFVVGVTSALVALGVGGQLGRQELVVGVLWAPFVLLGFLLSIPLRRRIRPDQVRQVILVLATVSGVTVIIRSLLG